jgi:hypothetical protein
MEEKCWTYHVRNGCTNNQAEQHYLTSNEKGGSMVNKAYERSPTLTRSLGRPKNRWEDDVKSDRTRMEITNWKDCIRNRIKWKKLVEKAKTSLKLSRLKKKKKNEKEGLVSGLVTSFVGTVFLKHFIEGKMKGRI